MIRNQHSHSAPDSRTLTVLVCQSCLALASLSQRPQVSILTKMDPDVEVDEPESWETLDMYAIDHIRHYIYIYIEYIYDMHIFM